MILIDGKKAAAELREELKQEVAELKKKYNKVAFAFPSQSIYIEKK